MGKEDFVELSKLILQYSLLKERLKIQACIVEQSFNLTAKNIALRDRVSVLEAEDQRLVTALAEHGVEMGTTGHDIGGIAGRYRTLQANVQLKWEMDEYRTYTILAPRASITRAGMEAYTDLEAAAPFLSGVTDDDDGW
jgi:hypothetical protein